MASSVSSRSGTSLMCLRRKRKRRSKPKPFPERQIIMSDAIIDVQNVTVSFDGFKVLDGLNFSIDYGELRFLIGPNGAGKSTLLDIMTGKTRPDKGKVIFDKHVNVTRVTEYQLVREGIGRKFQTPTIFSSLTVYQNLEAAIGFKTSIYRLGGKLSGIECDRVEETLATINL